MLSIKCVWTAILSLGRTAQHAILGSVHVHARKGELDNVIQKDVSIITFFW